MLSRRMLPKRLGALSAVAPRSLARMVHHSLIPPKTQPTPGARTTVLLKHLPNTATIEKLKEATKLIDYVRAEMEPGCLMHLTSEAQAEVGAKKLAAKYGVETSIYDSSMPSVVIHNLPANFHAKGFMEAAESLGAKSVRIIGTRNVQVMASNAVDALSVENQLKRLKIFGPTATTQIVKISDDKYLVSVSNFPPELSLADAEAAVNACIAKLGVIPGPTFTHEGSKETAKLRFDSKTPQATIDKLTASLRTGFGTEGTDACKVIPMKKPCLVFRKVREHSADDMKMLLRGTNCEKLQLLLPGNGSICIDNVDIVENTDAFHQSKQEIPDRIYNKSHEEGHPKGRVDATMLEATVPASKVVTDGRIELAVAYYKSEADALAALNGLRGGNINGKKYSVLYKEFAEPAVKVTNLPENCDVKDLLERMSQTVIPSRHEMLADKSLQLVFGSPNEVNLAMLALDGRMLEFEEAIAGKEGETKTTSATLRAEESYVYDTAVEVTLPSGSQDSASKLDDILKSVGVLPASVDYTSNVSAFVGFMELDSCRAFRDAFYKGYFNDGQAFSIANNPINITTLPTYSMEVTGLGESTPVTQLTRILLGDGRGDAVQPLRVDRNALVKFRRNKFVLPGMMKLKHCYLDDQYLKPVRYQPDDPLTGVQTEYDTEMQMALAEDDSLIQEARGMHPLPVGAPAPEKKKLAVGARNSPDDLFDRMTLRTVVQDYLQADPVTRFQIAKNQFERRLADATALKDADILLNDFGNAGGTKYFPDHVISEANKLLEAERTDAVSDRLFELFLQRDDMLHFLEDFKQMEALFGPADPSDPYDWSQFQMDSADDMYYLEQSLQIANKLETTGFRKFKIPQKLIDDFSEGHPYAINALAVALREEEFLMKNKPRRKKMSKYEWFFAKDNKDEDKEDPDEFVEKDKSGQPYSDRSRAILLKGFQKFFQGDISEKQLMANPAFRERVQQTGMKDRFEKRGGIKNVLGDKGMKTMQKVMQVIREEEERERKELMDKRMGKKVKKGMQDLTGDGDEEMMRAFFRHIQGKITKKELLKMPGMKERLQSSGFMFMVKDKDFQKKIGTIQSALNQKTGASAASIGPMLMELFAKEMEDDDDDEPHADDGELDGKLDDVDEATVHEMIAKGFADPEALDVGDPQSSDDEDSDDNDDDKLEGLSEEDLQKELDKLVGQLEGVTASEDNDADGSDADGSDDDEDADADTDSDDDAEDAAEKEETRKLDEELKKLQSDLQMDKDEFRQLRLDVSETGENEGESAIIKMLEDKYSDKFKEFERLMAEGGQEAVIKNLKGQLGDKYDEQYQQFQKNMDTDALADDSDSDVGSGSDSDVGSGSDDDDDVEIEVDGDGDWDIEKDIDDDIEEIKKLQNEDGEVVWDIDEASDDEDDGEDGSGTEDDSDDDKDEGDSDEEDDSDEDEDEDEESDVEDEEEDSDEEDDKDEEENSDDDTDDDDESEDEDEDKNDEVEEVVEGSESDSDEEFARFEGGESDEEEMEMVEGSGEESDEEFGFYESHEYEEDEDDEDFDNFYDADEEEAEMRRKKREVRRQEAFAKATADEDSGTWEDVKVRFEGEDEETMKNLERWIRRGAGDAVGDDSVDGGGAQGEHKMVYNELGEQVVATHKLENVLELKDKDGRQWYGAILNNDTVQKVMPGDRQMSARCLVVIGNARGTAGFGMGKGKEASDALNAAFRAATRNLVHIDLYDNFGLYHDVYGKHNNCHAIIKAYGKNKEPTTSEFAQTVLDCFGITGCSAKLMGRRDPYAMVNAMFNAVANHCNIDEQAKGRGKRYITLKWAKDRDL